MLRAVEVLLLFGGNKRWLKKQTKDKYTTYTSKEVRLQQCSFLFGGFGHFLKAFWLIFEIYTGLILIEFYNAIMTWNILQLLFWHEENNLSKYLKYKIAYQTQSGGNILLNIKIAVSAHINLVYVLLYL